MSTVRLPPKRHARDRGRCAAQLSGCGAAGCMIQLRLSTAGPRHLGSRRNLRLARASPPSAGPGAQARGPRCPLTSAPAASASPPAPGGPPSLSGRARLLPVGAAGQCRGRARCGRVRPRAGGHWQCGQRVRRSRPKARSPGESGCPSPQTQPLRACR